MAMAVSWFSLIVFEYYFERNLITTFSFAIEDPPWMPPNSGPSQALIGLHHFGDYQIWLGYAAVNNPYASFILYPPQTPPQTVWLFKAFLQLGFEKFLGVPKTLLGFWIVSAISWVAGLTQQFKESSLSKSELRLWITLSLFSIPLIVTFDRGSLQFVVVAFCLLFVRSVTRNQRFLAALFFVIAVSLKPYCALLLLWPVSERKWRVVFESTITFLFITIIGLWRLPDSFNQSLRSLYKALSGHVAGPDMSWLSNSVSGPAALWKLTNITHVQALTDMFNSNSKLVLICISLAIISAIALIVVSPVSNSVESLIILMSGTQLVVPLSGAYTALWTVALIPLLLRTISDFRSNQKTKGFDSRMILCTSAFSVFALVSLLPLPGSIQVGGLTYRYAALIAPLGMTLMIFILAVVVGVETIRGFRPRQP
jgi:hypothetical protein